MGIFSCKRDLQRTASVQTQLVLTVVHVKQCTATSQSIRPPLGMTITEMDLHQTADIAMNAECISKGKRGLLLKWIDISNERRGV